MKFFMIRKFSRLTFRDHIASSALSGLVGIQVKRHRVAGNGLEKIQKRVSVGLVRYPIERKTHQSLLTQHLRNVSDRLKSSPRLISTSFSIVYNLPFFFLFILYVHIDVMFALSCCDDRYPKLHSRCFMRIINILCNSKKK